MGRRRRKQERAERESLPSPDAQGELLALEDELEAEAQPDEASADHLRNGGRRDLVLFEIVDDALEVATPVEAPAESETSVAEVDPVDQVGPVDSVGPADAVEPAPDLQPPPPSAVPSARPLFDDSANFEAALEQLEAARSASPDDVPMLVNLGWTLGALGRFEDSERELRRAQKLAPDDVSVRAGLGILSFRRGLYQQADIELRWVCEQDPEHGPAHFYRGEALNRLGRVDQAMEVLERTTVLQPHNHRAFYTLGILFDRKNLREQAAAMYRKARELQRR